mmetsp:Transcript_89740/g.231693  ORF Transcript_89740/g.231693 Transcript_89740/m.231693 type:complete len:292 (-) Transcript_89740:654-1529(-)
MHLLLCLVQLLPHLSQRVLQLLLARRIPTAHGALLADGALDLRRLPLLTARDHSQQPLDLTLPGLGLLVAAPRELHHHAVHRVAHQVALVALVLQLPAEPLQLPANVRVALAAQAPVLRCRVAVVLHLLLEVAVRVAHLGLEGLHAGFHVPHAVHQGLQLGGTVLRVLRHEALGLVHGAGAAALGGRALLLLVRQGLAQVREVLPQLQALRPPGVLHAFHVGLGLHDLLAKAGAGLLLVGGLRAELRLELLALLPEHGFPVLAVAPLLTNGARQLRDALLQRRSCDLVGLR